MSQTCTLPPVPGWVSAATVHESGLAQGILRVRLNGVRQEKLPLLRYPYLIPVPVPQVPVPRVTLAPPAHISRRTFA